jgi:hypothetical protein
MVTNSPFLLAASLILLFLAPIAPCLSCWCGMHGPHGAPYGTHMTPPLRLKVMFVMFSDKSIIACNTTQGISGKEEYSVRNFCELSYQEKRYTSCSCFSMLDLAICDYMVLGVWHVSKKGNACAD